MILSELLLKWYDANARSLPWRGERDPYRIWLSEIMLQQTRTETVMRYYDRFLNAFPTVHDLAGAEEDRVLKLWEGLGYYSRARNLHAAAKYVSRELHGYFPENADGLRKLRGVGPYAANAIASIAYGECVPALDGNQARVLSRVFACDSPLKTPFDLLEPALKLISRDRPGDYNQALMDLGASVCTPKNPRCGECPIALCCQAQALGDPESFPKKLPPVPKREEEWTIVLAVSDRGIAMRRRPGKGLLAGLYEFPAVEGYPDAGCLAAKLPGFSGVEYLRPLPDSKHVFTHLVWRMKGALVRADAAPEEYVWVKDLSQIAVSSAIRAYREIAEEILCGKDV